MVGFNPDDKISLSKLGYAFAGLLSGSASGVATRLLCQPLDVLKIRFQLQIEPTYKPLPHVGSKYHGIRQAVVKICQEEGVRALWKGHVPAQALSLVYGGVQFATIELLTKVAWDYLPHVLTTDYQPFTHLVCGGIAGSVGTVVAQPLDVIRTRLVGQGEPKVYNTLRHAAKVMYRTEGWQSFFRGLTPAVAQAMPNTALQFGSYTLCLKVWKSLFLKVEPANIGVVESAVCGFVAGIAAKTVIYPLDVAKKRLQIQGFEEARRPFGETRQYSGLRHCLKLVYREEGILGVYKGLRPSLIKAGVTTGLHFMWYELCRRIFIRWKDR